MNHRAVLVAGDAPRDDGARSADGDDGARATGGDDSAVVVGVGSGAMGDDGAGIEVVRRLAARGKLGVCVRLEVTRDPSQLVTLLDGCAHAVIVDAVLDPTRVGTATRLDLSVLAQKTLRTSTHGVDVLAALQLLDAVAGRCPGAIDVVAVPIAETASGTELSPDTQRGVDAAAELVESLLSSAS
jgi:hydrogenase maturation protease